VLAASHRDEGICNMTTKSTKAATAKKAVPAKPVRSKGGRPRALVADDRTLRQLYKLGELQATVREAAGVLLCGESTLEAFLGPAGPKEARDAWEGGRQAGRVSIRRKQMQVALRGSVTMLIWLGKQYLDQRDKLERTDTLDATIKTAGINLQVLQTPDLEAFSDKKQALKAFEDFRRQIESAEPAPTVPQTDKDKLQ
jgi:hypothetical protein